MKKNFYSQLFVILVLIFATVSCKKEDIKHQSDTLENSNWSLFQTTFYYPDLYHESEITNSLWAFSPGHKIKIYNHLRFIQEEDGEWHRTTDNKIVIDIKAADGNLAYTQTFEIIHEAELFMELETKDVHVTGAHGVASKGTYLYYKIK